MATKSENTGETLTGYLVPKKYLHNIWKGEEFNDGYFVLVYSADELLGRAMAEKVESLYTKGIYKCSICEKFGAHLADDYCAYCGAYFYTTIGQEDIKAEKEKKLIEDTQLGIDPPMMAMKKVVDDSLAKLPLE